MKAQMLLREHIIKKLFTYHKDSALFDAPAASGMRRMQPGTHWAIHIYSDAIKPATVISTDMLLHTNL